ncbi:MAG TPA: PqqD family protein [Clostridiales bacterium]|nr:PqqD family protein [Clostridiales bacterium]
MKIKNGFVMKEVAGSNVVVKVCGNVDFDSMMTLNESAAILWKKLEDGADFAQLIETLLTEYETNRKTAEKDVLVFVKKLEDAGILE